MKSKLINSKIGFSLVAIMLFAFFSQEAFAVSFKKKHRRQSESIGRHSLQLAINNDLLNDSHSGITLSVNSLLSKNSATRFSLGFGNPSRKYYFSDGILYSDDVIYLNDNIDVDRSLEINLAAQYMLYPSFNRHYNMYFGIGPVLTFDMARQNTSYSYYDDYTGYEYWDTYTEDWHSLSFGLAGTIGSELFLAPRLSLIAEYEFSLQKEWLQIEHDVIFIDGGVIDRTTVYEEDNTFTTSQMKVGMAFHF
jgi:hypothetical protein